MEEVEEESEEDEDEDGEGEVGEENLSDDEVPVI
jgi:hypothetical protein